MTADSPLDQKAVVAWLKEREDNCHRIAKQKFGADRNGWLEDAKFFHAAIAYLTARVPDDVGEVVKRLLESADRLRAPFLAETNVETIPAGRITEAAVRLHVAADLLTRQSERIRGLEAEVERLNDQINDAHWDAVERDEKS